MFQIPNIENAPTYAGQAVPDSTDWTIIGQQFPAGVISGLAVTASSTASMTLQVAGGSALINGIMTPNIGTTTVTIATASSSDRRDLIALAPGGTIDYIEGVPCGTANWTTSSSGSPPVKPALPVGDVALAEVYVPASATSIPSENIIDKRVFVNQWLAGHQFPVVDAQAFGVQYGNSAVDNSGALNHAISYLNGIGGGILTITGPTWIANTVRLLQNVHIMGTAVYDRVTSTASFSGGGYLAPNANFPTTGAALLTVGQSGNGTAQPTNPHGSRIIGLGFSGLNPSGSSVAGVTGLLIQDTAEVYIEQCVFLGCASNGIEGISTVGNYQGVVSTHVLTCDFNANGVAINIGGTGSTDGYVANCLIRNSTTANVYLGYPSNLGGGGFLFVNCHFVAIAAASHVVGGNQAADIIFTNCYFDITNTVYIQGIASPTITGCYFFSTSTQNVPYFISLPGNNPRCAITGCTINTNGNTNVKGLVQLVSSSAVLTLVQVHSTNVISGTSLPATFALVSNSSGDPIITGSVTPTSGSATTNSTSGAVLVYLPVTFSPASTAAATVSIAIAVGATSTTIGTWSQPAGSATGVEQTISFMVPATGTWTATATNASLGTATYIYMWS
jgi:hypothetical protein